MRWGVVSGIWRWMGLVWDGGRDLPAEEVVPAGDGAGGGFASGAEGCWRWRGDGGGGGDYHCGEGGVSVNASQLPLRSTCPYST